MIQLKNVHKAFGQKRVLDGFTLDVPEGETMVIIGYSGTGKSVAIKHIVGLLEPDEGEVWVDGLNVPELSRRELYALRARIGYVFQFAALFDSYTIGENVSMGLRKQGELSESEIALRVEEALDLVDLPGVQERFPAELSGGMRKRAGFARALVLDPAIVMFDEPDSGLDPVRTALLCELIREVHEENGGCYLVISHDLGTARRIADFLAVLWKGRIVESGPADELFNSRNEFVNQFLNADVKGPLAMD